MRGNGGNGDGDLVRTEGLASTLNVGNVPSSVFEGSAWKGGGERSWSKENDKNMGRREMKISRGM